MNLYDLKEDFKEIARFVTNEPDRITGYIPRVFSLTNNEILNAIIASHKCGKRIISHLNGDPQFVSAYGEEASRFLLSFLRKIIDNYFSPEKNADFQITFNDVWNQFEKYLTGEDYIYIEIAPVFLTEGEKARIELPGPVYLYKWGNKEFRDSIPLSIKIQIIDDLAVVGPYTAEYVIVATERVKKIPQYLLKVSFPGSVLTDRISGAFNVMRLYAEGDIYLGGVYRFRDPYDEYLTPLGAYSILRQSSNFPVGEKYNVDAIDPNRFRGIYDDIETFKEWPNISLALRRFAASYSRRSAKEDVLIDLIIVLESLLVTGTDQIAHKLASNAAVILTRKGGDKLNLYNELKKCYRIRSRLVHGVGLHNEDREYLRKLPKLNEIARRLLVGFIRTAVAEGDSWYKDFHSRLDCLVVDEDLLSKLKTHFP